MSKETPTGNNDGFMIKVFFIVALYSSFVFSGVYEEKLYKGTYSPSNESPDMKIKFSHPLLAILCNSIVAYAISALVLNSM